MIEFDYQPTSKSEASSSEVKFSPPSVNPVLGEKALKILQSDSMQIQRIFPEKTPREKVFSPISPIPVPRPEIQKQGNAGRGRSHSDCARRVYQKRQNIRKSCGKSRSISDADFSLLSPRLALKRNYYPIKEFKKVKKRLNIFSFEKITLMTGKEERKFNKDLRKYLRREINRTEKWKVSGAYNRFSVTAHTSHQLLEDFCRDELYELSKEGKATAISLSITNSPRSKELVKIIKESGLLLNPLIQRLLFIFNQLISYHQVNKKYTTWSKNLHRNLWNLVKPEACDFGEYGKKIQSFLEFLDKINNSKKIAEIVNEALGGKNSNFKILIGYLREWANLPVSNLANFKERVKAWSSDNLALTEMDTWMYELELLSDRIDKISLSEAIRCLGNEDNGVVVIPNQIQINNKVIYKKGDQYPSLHDFFISLVSEIYTNLGQHTEFCKEDVEILFLSCKPYEHRKKALFDLLYPISFQNLMACLQEKNTMKIEDIPGNEIKTRLFPPQLLEFLTVMDLDTEKIAIFCNVLYRKAKKDIEKLKQEHLLNAKPLMEETFIHRILHLTRVLRLFTISCWSQGHECIKKIYPKLQKPPFKTKYEQGMIYDVKIKGPEKFSVVCKRTLLIEKMNNESSEPLVKIPFSWRIRPLKKNWQGSLSISGKLNFKKDIFVSDKWEIFKALLHGPEDLEEHDDPFSPRARPKHSRLLTE